MASKGVRKLHFAFLCGDFGVIIVGLGNSGADGVTGEQTGSGGGLIFGRCFGVDDKFFFFALRCEEKNRLGAGTEAFGVNYLIFFGSLWGFFFKADEWCRLVCIGSERNGSS